MWQLKELWHGTGTIVIVFGTISKLKPRSMIQGFLYNGALEIKLGPLNMCKPLLRYTDQTLTWASNTYPFLGHTTLKSLANHLTRQQILISFKHVCFVLSCFIIGFLTEFIFLHIKFLGPCPHGGDSFLPNHF